MAHMKRYRMPKEWPLSRKERVWVVRPRPGPHNLGKCIPLQVVLRDVLGFAETAKEARRILSAGKVLVDRVARKEPGFPVGLMDSIEIPELKKHFRVTVNENGLVLEEAPQAEAGKKLCRIKGKTTLKGGVQQLNLHDGRCILTGKKESYRPGDSLLLQLPEQKLLKHFKMGKGANALVIAGKNIGLRGRIAEVRNKETMLEKSVVILDVGKGKTLETLKDYVLVGEVK